jgi:hypothetical protein
MTQIPKNLNDLSSRLRKGSDNWIERFSDVRDYLDMCDADSVDIEIFKSLLTDDDELIRSESADFAVVSGGISSDFLVDILKTESSELVYPMLWIALAIEDADAAKPILVQKDHSNLSLYARCFYDGAAYLAFDNPFYLYDLCAIACSPDSPASYSAIDVLYIVARDREALLAEVLDDLRKMKAENADKASAVFGIEVSREPTAR